MFDRGGERSQQAVDVWWCCEPHGALQHGCHVPFAAPVITCFAKMNAPPLDARLDAWEAEQRAKQADLDRREAELRDRELSLREREIEKRSR